MKSWRVGFLTIRGGSGVLATLVVVAAVVLGLLPKFTEDHLLFTPENVFSRFELWQVVSYLVFPYPSVLSILFGVMILLGMGSQLEARWGTLRLMQVLFGIGITTAVLTTIVGLFSRFLGQVPFAGVHVLTLVVWVGFGLEQRHHPVNFWGINVSGYMFALIGFGFSFFMALFGRWQLAVPELFAAALTYFVVHQRYPGALWMRFRSWQLQRDLDKRSAHLRKIDGGRANMGRDSDKYLH
jgi:membrane associated rhomboid family serine protease